MAKLDARDLEGQQFIEAAHTERRYNCIFCDDSKYHLYVNFSKGVFHCFKCEMKGKLIQREGTNLGTFDSDKIMRHLAHFEDQYFNKPDLEKTMIKTLPRSVRISSLKTSLTRHIQYLSNRGLSPSLIDKLDVHYSTDTTGIYTETVIFPVYELKARPAPLEYFVARKIDGGEPKYINAPWPKGSTTYHLWNQDKDVRWRCTAVCEGLFDAIALHKEGVYEVHALLGKKATTAQLEKIASSNGLPILIFLDYDAFTYAVQLKMALSNLVLTGRKVEVVLMPKGDPDKLHQRGELKEVLDSCVYSSPR